MIGQKNFFLDEDIAKQFNVDRNAILMESGEGRTYRSGNIVLKHINNDSLEQTKWIIDLFHNINEDGFRVSRPIASLDGKWITNNGWSAWIFLEGNHEYKRHIPLIINAIIDFHKAIKNVPRPSFFDEDSEYRRSDRYAWGDLPNKINPKIEPLVKKLFAFRKPVEGIENQIIHGDLGPANILLVDTLKPGIIDIAPYYRPVEFALAVFAYWIGPWTSDMDVLKYFEKINHFDQMLVRAGIRMLMTKSEFNMQGDAYEEYSKSTNLIIKYLEQK